MVYYAADDIIVSKGHHISNLYSNWLLIKCFAFCFKYYDFIHFFSAKPIYQGSFNPNRFGIRPGHRWDGVVRSSGYEKEWFTHQNARKARDEEAYKWSTSDM